MEELKAFEEGLYGDLPVFEYTQIVDLDFWVDRLVSLPLYRPQYLNETCKLCQEYCLDSEFKKKMIIKAKSICNVLIHRLFLIGVIDIDEIISLLDKQSFILSHYFRKYIDCFNEIILKMEKPSNYDDTLFSDMINMDQMIEYGFCPSTMEYCLKYDDYSTFCEIFVNPIISKKSLAKWSPFEWAKQPDSLDYLSFSGYFGSIKCFKHMITSGFEITILVFESVVCSGSMDLYHICESRLSNQENLIYRASQFFREGFLRFFFEDMNINKTMDNISKFFLLILLFR